MITTIPQRSPMRLLKQTITTPKITLDSDTTDSDSDNNSLFSIDDKVEIFTIDDIINIDDEIVENQKRLELINIQ